VCRLFRLDQLSITNPFSCFPVSRFPVLQFGLAFSSLAFSSLAFSAPSNYFVFITRKCGVVIFSLASVCVSVCLSVRNALTSESLDTTSYFCMHIRLENKDSSRSSGQGQDYKNQKACLYPVCGWSAFV